MLNRNNLVIVVLLLAWLAYRDVIPVPGVPSSNKIDRVTYVYEKDEGGVPPGVASALMQLNTMGIIATDHDKDTVNGEGNTPAQYVIAMNETKTTGIPVLVFQAGQKVAKTIKPTVDPNNAEANMKLKAEILEAVK